MEKFNEKSLAYLPLATFCAVLQYFTDHIKELNTDRESVHTLRDNLLNHWNIFFQTYHHLSQSEDALEVAQLDMKRDSLMALLLNVTQQWLQKMDNEVDTCHAQRVWTLFHDYDSSLGQSVEEGNKKIQAIVDELMDHKELIDDLRILGLSELNQYVFMDTRKISQLLSKRGCEQTLALVNEVKLARQALDSRYRDLITHLNAIQEVCPSEAISQQARLFNAFLALKLPPL